MKKRTKKAFTLAEVLITLTIIGVAAAITVPVMNISAKDREITAGAKKAYSILNQFLDMYQADTGSRLTREDIPLRSDALYNLMAKYISSIKDCGMQGEKAEGCLKPADLNNVYKTYNGNNMDTSWLDEGQYILADGMALFINSGGSGIAFSVDVNGSAKKPNRLGKDLFFFFLDNDGFLYPGGAENIKGKSSCDLSQCSGNSTYNMNGAGCTIKVLQE